MENHQIQQPSSQLDDSNPASPSRRRQAPTDTNPLLGLIAHHPWLLWTGVSLFLLAMVAGAIISLMHADIGEQDEPVPPPVASEPVAASPQASSSIPLWVLGAIALSCGTGSLLLWKRLNRPSSPPQLRARHKHFSARVMPTQAASSQRHQSRKRHTKRVLPVPVPVPSLTTVKPVSVSTEPVVTVLPPEQSYIDRREADLAEMMDLRKQQSLASILRNF